MQKALRTGGGRQEGVRVHGLPGGPGDPVPVHVPHARRQALRRRHRGGRRRAVFFRALLFLFLNKLRLKVLTPTRLIGPSVSEQ